MEVDVVESGNWKSEALLGGVIVAVIGVLVWLTFSLGGGAARGSHSYVFVFDTALGLSVDNTVAIAGVKVGVVDDISVDGRRARVTVRIDPAVTLHGDARAAVRQKTLLGEKYVDLDPGSDSAPALLAGAVVEHNVRTVELDQVMRDASVLIERLNAITPPLEAAIGGLNEAMKGKDGRAITDELVGALRDVRALMQNTNAVVSGTGDDVRAVLALARDKGPSLVARLDAAAGRIDAILAALDGAKLGNAVERLAPAAETVASGVQGASKDLHLVTSDMRDAARRMDALFARLDATLGRLDGIDEAAVREFLQVQGVRVNVLPDPAVAGLVKSLREKSPEKKPSKPSKSTTSSPGSRGGTPAQP